MAIQRLQILDFRFQIDANPNEQLMTFCNLQSEILITLRAMLSVGGNNYSSDQKWRLSWLG
jgi:hypothetical protein